MRSLGQQTLAEVLGRKRPTASGRLCRAYAVRSSGVDLEDAARESLRKCGEIIRRCKSAGSIALATVCADAEAARFPELLCNYFADEEFDHSNRFVVAGLTKTDSGYYSPIGRLTFEARPTTVRQVVSWDTGIVWAANLWVGGIIVPESDVEECLKRDPTEDADVALLENWVEVAFALDNDLLDLTVGLFDSRPEAAAWLEQAWNETPTV